MEAIELGARVCKRLKVIYFSEKAWVDCHEEVALKFTALKQIAKKFYGDKEELEVLRELAKYTDDGIKDAFECST